MRGVSHFRAVFRRGLAFFPAFRAADGRAAALFHTLAQVKNGVRAVFISCFFAFAVFAAQAVALTHSAAAQTNAAANMTLQAEIEKKSPSLVTVLQALDAGADPDHKAGEVPLLIVAATMGHAEIVSVLVTAGADPDARWKRASCVSQTVGRAVPHLVAQNNFSPTLYYTWGTALNVLRHFADAVNQTANATTYDWNAEGVSPNCGSTNPAIDFLASRFRNDDASLPEESDDEKYLAIMGMADIMLANKASCANAGIPKHVTCAGSAAAAEVCSPGQGVMYGGNLGGWTYDGIWCVDCPVGQGVLANNTCGVCPAGQVVQGGICVAIATCDSPAVLNAETNQCDCPSGYSGAGGVCNADVTVSFSPPVNGTLSAASGGDSIQNGGTVVHGATVTFTATPASGYEVSIWTGGCAGAVGVSCEAVATVNVSAGVEFFEASAASCGRLSPAKGYDDSGAGACVAPSAASCGRLSPVKGYDDSGAGACVAASAASCRRLSPAQGYDDSGAGACEVCSSGEGVLADGTCGVCLAGQVILGGACTAPSAASCRRLSPAQGLSPAQLRRFGRRGVRGLFLRRGSPCRWNLRRLSRRTIHSWRRLHRAQRGKLREIVSGKGLRRFGRRRLRCAQRGKLRKVVSDKGLRRFGGGRLRCARRGKLRKVVSGAGLRFGGEGVRCANGRVRKVKMHGGGTELGRQWPVPNSLD